MTATGSQTSRKTVLLVSIALIIYTAGFAAFVYLAPANWPHYALVVDLGQLITPIAAAAACLMASRAAVDNRRKLAWRLLEIAAVTWTLGQLAWVLNRYVIPAEPLSLLPAAFWAIWYPIAFIGLLLMLPRIGSSSFRAITAIDALMFTIGALGLGWQIVLFPSILPFEDTFTVAVNVGWLAGDMLLLFPAISLVLRGTLSRIAISSLLIMGAFCANLIADLGFTTSEIVGGYRTGLPTDPFWPLAYALFAVAALAYIRETASGTSSQFNTATSRTVAHLRNVLSYLALPAAGIMLFLEHADSSLAGSYQSVAILSIALFLLAATMLRQYLTYRVISRRTRELEAMDYAATMLSQCTESVQVLHTGLQIAGEALNAAGGMAWVLDEEGEIAPAGALGLSTRIQEAINECCSSHNALEGVAANCSPSQLNAEKKRSLCQDVGALSSLLLVPMISRGNVLGIVGLAARKAKPFEESQVRMASAIASQIGMALENSRRFEEIKLLADRDSVTGLLNHRRVKERLNEEIARVRRTGEPVSVVMMDLDGFKRLNDTFGHPAGDDMLRLTATLLNGVVRVSDVVGRYGGDEFIAVLLGTDAPGARVVAERMRVELEKHPYLTEFGEAAVLRMSFGIATYPDGGLESQDLIESADTNLYRSKQRGGNIVTCGLASREVRVN